MSEEKKTTDFTTATTPEYKELINRARQRSAVPLGGAEMPNIPPLDSIPRDPHAGVQAQRMKEAMGAAAPQETIANPPRAEGGLRAETVQMLADMGKAKDKQASEEDKKEEEVKRVLEELNYDEMASELEALSRKDRRKLIEDRIEDKIDVGDLILYQELRQTVPIVPGKFFPTYRTTTGEEDLFVKREMGEDRGASQAYVSDKFSLMSLCCGLYALNGKVLPDHRDSNGRIDKKLFYAKLEYLLRYPLSLLTDLSVNFSWFGLRVQRLLIVDELKNF